MDCLNIQLYYITVLLIRKCPDTILNFFSHFAGQDSESVPWDPDYVILAIP